MVGTDGDAKLVLDEGVVDEVSHIFECLPIVFTDTVTKMQLDPQTTAMTNIHCSISVKCFMHFSPPVEVRLAESHHKHRHLKCRQHQQHLGEESEQFVQHIGLFFSLLFLLMQGI